MKERQKRRSAYSMFALLAVILTLMLSGCSGQKAGTQSTETAQTSAEAKNGAGTETGSEEKTTEAAVNPDRSLHYWDSSQECCFPYFHISFQT